MIPPTWLIGGVGAVLLAGAIGVQEIRLSNARTATARIEGERDVAREELRTVGLALEAQRGSTKAAADDVERCMASYQATNHTHLEAIRDLRAAAQRHRLQLRKCDTTAVVAERLGQRWPASRPAP